MKSKSYRAKRIKQVNLEGILNGRTGQEATIGLDIGKSKILGIVRWGKSDFERPWIIENPGGIQEFVGLISEIAKDCSLIFSILCRNSPMRRW